MNTEIATYIRGLSGELAKDIWLDILISAKRNGTANVVIRDYVLKYRISEAEFKEAFNPAPAEKIGMIKILADQPTFISINFKKKEVPVKVPKEIQIQEAKAAEAKELQVKDQNNYPAIIPVKKDEFGLIIGQINRNHKFSGSCGNYIIGEYKRFYKKLQINNSMLVGIPDIKPIDPKISEKDNGQLRLIARHFISIGFNTEANVIHAFRKMYDQWDDLPDRLQGMTSPAAIYACLNDIVIELHKINNRKPKQPKQTPKDEQFSSKVQAARQKDYSHLAKP